MTEVIRAVLVGMAMGLLVPVIVYIVSRACWELSEMVSRIRFRNSADWTDDQIRQTFLPNGCGKITAARIAPNSITSAKIADNIEFPDWFKMYTPEELEVKLAQRRRDNLMKQPWIVRTVVVARVRIWSAILRFFRTP